MNVSVVIPVRNGERFLAEALDSVAAQTHAAGEIVMVDGGSTDRSPQIARSYEGVRVIAQQGKGLAGAWNEGIAHSSGELIAFLDSDDRWLPGKLASQVELLRAEPELAGAVGLVRFFLEPGHEPPPGFRQTMAGGEHVANMPGALLVRRSTFERIGDFDESYRIAIDIEWFARLKDAGMELGTVDEVVIEKRVHDANLSHSDLAINDAELVRLLRDSIAKQRGKR